MSRRKIDWFMCSSVLLLFTWAMGCVWLLENVSITEQASDREPMSSIKVLTRTGKETEAIQQIIPMFEQEVGIKVELVELSRDGYFTALATQLFAGTDQFDLALVPSTFVPQFASAGALEPLDHYIYDPSLTDQKTFDINDFVMTYGYRGETYALPTDISTHFLYYRSDLIAHPPQTWEELLEVAARFSRVHNKNSPTEWGLGLTGLGPEELPKVYDTILWSYGGDIVRDNEVILDSKSAIQAGKILERMMKEQVASPDIVSWGFPEVLDELLRGTIAMAAPHWNAAVPMIASSNSPYKDVIKVALVPGVRQADGRIRRTPFQHGWALAINRNSLHKREAWRFLLYATGKRGGQIYARGGGTPARYSILSDPLLTGIRPEFPLIIESLRLGKTEPAVTYYPTVHEIQNEALTKILTLYEKPEAALADAGNKLRSIVIHNSVLNLNKEEEKQ